MELQKYLSRVLHVRRGVMMPALGIGLVLFAFIASIIFWTQVFAQARISPGSPAQNLSQPLSPPHESDGIIGSKENRNLTLEELFVLDRLFSKGEVLDPDRTSIGDLLILNQLFGNGRTEDILRELKNNK